MIKIRKRKRFGKLLGDLQLDLLVLLFYTMEMI